NLTLVVFHGRCAMSMTLKERALFLQKTADVFETHRRCARAAGKCVFYRLEDLRGGVERDLARGACLYCRVPLSVATFVLDHRVPIPRGGRFVFRNLEVCCRDCHLLKGFLDAQEFRELLALLASWPKPLQQHFRARLRAGASLVRTALPVPGTLAWYTGAEPETEEKAHEMPGD